MDQDRSTSDGGVVNRPDGLPGRDQVVQLLVPASRPFLIAADRELSVLRRGLTKAGWKRGLYLQDGSQDLTSLSGAGLLSRANYWLDAEITIPERGGHYHHFFCDDGARLEVEKHRTEAGTAYRCPACGRTYSGAKYDDAFRWFEHQSLALGCLALALIYQIDRDPAYVGKASEILRKYAAAYPGPHTGPTTGGIMHQSLDEAGWIVPLAQAYDLIYHSKALANHDRESIERGLFRQVARGLIEAGTAGIWGAWHNSAVGLIGCAIKDADLLSLALGNFAVQLRDEVGDDGLWPESVHTFHFYALSAFVSLAETCTRIGIDLYNLQAKPGKTLKLMFLAPVNYAYPCFRLPAIDNGWYYSTLPLSLYEVAYRRWGDPVFAWVLKTGYGFAHKPLNQTHVDNRPQFTRSSLYAFLFGRDLPGRIRGQRLISTVFPSHGMCVLRSDKATMLTFDYGPCTAGGQLDRMGITLYAHGRILAADYGSPGYGSAVIGYYTGTACHNTVIVDGKPQMSSACSYPIVFHPGDYLQSAEAECQDTYPGVSHTRRLVLAGDVVLVSDRLESAIEHTYDWLLHCEGECADAPEDSRPAQPVSEHFTDAREIARATDYRATSHFGDAGVAAWLSMDGMGEVIFARSPAETAARTVPVIDLRRRAASARYLALLVPYSGALPTIERRGRVFKVVSGDAIDWLYVADAPGGDGDDHADIQSDAELAAVREVAGEVVGFGLYNGSYIDLRGDALVSGAGRFARIEGRLDLRSPIINFDGPSGGQLRLRCRSRAMRVNGHRVAAANLDGVATIRLIGVLAGA